MKQFFEGLAYSALKIFCFFLGRIPLSWALRLGEWAGSAFFWISSRRRVAYADLKAALGSQFSEKERWQVLRRHYRHLGQMAMEVLRFPSLDLETIKKIFHVDDPQKIQNLLQKGRGAVLVTAHFGNWELTQVGFSMVTGKQVHVLARKQKHTVLDQILNELRQSHGAIAASRGIGIRALLRALAKRECIGVLGDQDAGKEGGIILPFLGRKTTVPTGAFELALRTNAPIVIGFLVRTKAEIHQGYVAQILDPEEFRSVSPEHALENLVKSYLRHLEDFIRRFPDQWLWESKRWKYSWTKRILILSDGKPGHFKQSEAVAAQFRKIKTQYGRTGLEYPTVVLPVHYKSKWHKRIFYCLAFFFLPWAQGRLGLLRFFFKPQTAKHIVEASADFIISAGASLVPLNLCLARDSRAKSIVLMKPSFPFNLFRYDLSIVPAHDRGKLSEDVLKTLLVPNRMEADELEEAAGKLRRTLRAPERVRLAVFLGGPTRGFEFEVSDIQKIFDSLAGSNAGDYLVTTSRRTPDSVSEFLKSNVAQRPSCQQLVIAKEDPRPEVAPGMMALADILIVTGDSISMISEAVKSGKKVIVLNFPSSLLPPKHRRFTELLVAQSAAVVASPENLGQKILEFRLQSGGPVNAPLYQEEEEMLNRRLQEIL